MREPAVLELFAHDRVDDAWRLATADLEKVDAVDKLVRSSRAQAWPVRSRLALSALEVLDGEVPSEPLVRSRSPAVEMPPRLRYLAHRTDARDQIVHGLARVRHSSAGWGWLVVDALDPHPPAEIVSYVQFTSYPGPRLRAEAMGNAHLPPDRHVDGEAEVRIRELGWREGSEEESSGNWVAAVRGGTRGNREANAELALTTLEVVFGCGPGTRYRVTTDVWSPEQAGPSPSGQAGE